MHKDTQAYASIGYMWATLRQIADGTTGSKTPAEYARWHMEKVAQEYPYAAEGLPRPQGVDW